MKSRDFIHGLGLLGIALPLIVDLPSPAIAGPNKPSAAAMSQASPDVQAAPLASSRAEEGHTSSSAPAVAEGGLEPRPWPDPLWLYEAPSFERRGGGHNSAERRDRGGQGHGGADHQPQPPLSEPASNRSSGRMAPDTIDPTGMGETSFGRGAASKTLILRRGPDPLDASDVRLRGEKFSLHILDAKNERFETPFAETGKGAGATVELKDYGFYSASVVRKSVQNGVLEVQIAQAELLKGAMAHGGRSNHDPALFRPTLDDAAPFELVREHKPDERLMTQIYSGETAAFVVRRSGKPVPGARVTLATQQGWRKTIKTDVNGRAQFQLVRDYFPDWSDFNRRHAGTFLVWAEFETPDTGSFDGRSYSVIRYQASMTARYYPAPFDYKSYGYGVGLVVFVSAFAGLVVWLHRQRRARPFKEVVFDEKLA